MLHVRHVANGVNITLGVVHIGFNIYGQPSAEVFAS